MHLQLNNPSLFLLSVMALLPAGCGESAYDLTPIFTQGEIRRDVLSTRMTGTVTCHNGEQQYEGTMDVVQESAVETDILAVDAGQPTRIRKAMLSSRSESTVNIGGESIVSEEVEPLAGRSVIMTKVDGAWKGRLVGGAPSPEQSLAIVQLQEAEAFEDVVPARELHIGESWVIGGDHFRRYMGDLSSSVFTGQMKLRFEQIVEFNGEACALLSAQIDFTMTAGPDEDLQGITKVSAEGHIYRSLTSRLDLSGEFVGTCEFTGELMEGGARLPMTMRGPIKISGSTTRDH